MITKDKDGVYGVDTGHGNNGCNANNGIKMVYGAH